MAYDFYAAYCETFHTLHGSDPCTRAEWAEWVRQPSSSGAKLSDVEFDHQREAEGDAQ